MAAARAFFGYVHELSEGVVDGKVATWTVRVREGSALLAVAPNPTVPPEVASLVYARAEHGIEHLINRNVDEAGLPEPALKHLRTLSEMTEAGPNKAPPVAMRIWIRKKPIRVEPVIASAIREDWRADYNDYGTIEGRLETIQESYGTLQFFIRDTLLRQRVKSYFPEELLPSVFERFRRRVEVSGIIHYRKNGTPISIEAEHIIGLPDDSELPTAGDVRGILRVDYMPVELVYLDANAYLGWLQAEPGSVELCNGTLTRADNGEVMIFTSALTIAEVLWMRNAPVIPEDKAEIVRKFFRRSYFRVRNVTRAISENAQDLVWKRGIRPKDAIHVATALDVGCAALETFDEPLIGKSGLIGSPAMIIRKPLPPVQGTLL
jgi:predicted nucleic acid-binding protein